MASNDNFEEDNVREDSSQRPRLGQRKSLTDTLSRFAANTANTFTRRRTTTDVPVPVPTSFNKFRSRLPPPPAISGGNSFFAGINALAPRSTPNSENHFGLSDIIKPRKTSNRAPLPSPESEDDDSVPLISTSSKRNSTLITHRSLMAPLNPPQPRKSIGGPRSSIGGPRASTNGPRHSISGNVVEANTPNFMRSTSSSTARSSGRGAPRSSLPESTMATLTPLRGQRLSTQTPRAKNFSRPIIKLNNPKVQSETSGAIELAEGDTDSSIHSSEAGMEDTTSGIIESPAIPPLQIPGDDEPSSVAGDLAKELELIREVQLEAETEPAVLECTLTPPMADQIDEAQHPIWWLGRFTSFSDRLRTEALNTSLKTSSIIPGVEPDTMHDDERRAREIFIHLRKLCATAEAEESLEEFGKIWAKRTGLENLDAKKKRTLLEMVMGKKKKGEGSKSGVHERRGLSDPL